MLSSKRMVRHSLKGRSGQEDARAPGGPVLVCEDLLKLSLSTPPWVQAVLCFVFTQTPLHVCQNWAVHGTCLRNETARQQNLSGRRARSLAQHALQGWNHRRTVQQAAALPHTRGQHTLPGHLQSCTAPRISTHPHIKSRHTPVMGQSGFRQLQQLLQQVTQQLLIDLDGAKPAADPAIQPCKSGWSLNPLYRLGSYDPAQHSQGQQPAQQRCEHMGSTPSISPQPTEAAVPAPAHRQVSTKQHAGRHSCLRPSEAAQPLLVQAAADTHCCQQCQVQTAQLISALIDANARVSAAREQLLAAQADINMLTGVVESQQHQLQAASAAHQQLLHMLAHHSTPTPLTPSPDNQNAVCLQSEARLCESGTWPVAAAGSSSYFASTCSTHLDSSMGSCSSETVGRATACAGSHAGEWAVTVQPQGSLGTHLHVTISRSRLCPGLVAGNSSAGSTSTAGGLDSLHGCQTVAQQQPQHAMANAMLESVPSVAPIFGHNSSFHCGVQSNKTPARPLSEG